MNVQNESDCLMCTHYRLMYLTREYRYRWVARGAVSKVQRELNYRLEIADR